MSRAHTTVEVAGATADADATGEPSTAFALVDLTTGADVAEPSEIGPRGVLLAVADGAGGAIGAVAGATALNLLRQRLLAAEAEPLPARLVRAVDATSFAIWHVSGVSGRTGMTTSLVAVVLDGDAAWVSWVGDARAYVARGDEFVRITDDHSAAPDAATGRGELLQAIGGRPAVSVAVRRLALRRDDAILLCSGALSSTMADEALRALLGREPSPRAASDRLVATATSARRAPGVVTAVVARFGGGLPDAPAGERVASTLVSVQELATPEPGDPIASDAPTPRYGLPPLPDGAAEG